MKTLDELNAIKEKVNKDKFGDKEGYRIAVGMATCGLAAGAKPVFEALQKEAKEQKLNNVSITKTGCIGTCRYEPIVDVIDSSGNKVTYIKVDENKAKDIINQHIKLGKPVMEYTVNE